MVVKVQEKIDQEQSKKNRIEQIEWKIDAQQELLEENDAKILDIYFKIKANDKNILNYTEGSIIRLNNLKKCKPDFEFEKSEEWIEFDKKLVKMADGALAEYEQGLKRIAEMKLARFEKQQERIKKNILDLTLELKELQR